MAKKHKHKKKKRARVRLVLAAIFSLLVLGGVLFLQYNGWKLWQNGGLLGRNLDADGEVIPKGTVFDGLNLTVLDVGQGLCLYVEADGHAMIYDGGGRDTSSEVVAFLQKQNIQKLDYVVASHYDEDHIAGLIGCLKRYSVGTVLCPDYQAGTDIYQSFLQAVSGSGAQQIHPKQGDRFTLGNAKFTVLGPHAYGAEKENNNSIAIRVVYGKFSMVVTGDAEVDEEKEILDSGLKLDSDLYIVGHHGSDSSSCRDLIAAISPKDAYISVGAGNDYGHPQVKTIASLEAYNVNIYRTDKQQDLSGNSDGYQYTEDQQPCLDHSDGNVYFDKNVQSGIHAYVVNQGSLIFHYPDCEAVEKMSTRNRKDVECTRDELIQEGYSPCGNCHP